MNEPSHSERARLLVPPPKKRKAHEDQCVLRWCKYASEKESANIEKRKYGKEASH